MVLIVGDTHGNITLNKLIRLRRECEENKRHMTKDDYVIVCGDFGLLWNYKWTGRHIDSNSKDQCWNEDEIELLEWYNSCPWTTLWVDGNHEGYDRLQTYPFSDWHGGRVQKISDSIIHLMRGEIYDIDGHTYFCMGGAMSTDRGYATGTEKFDIHKWWWPQEIPSSAEWENAYNNLDKVDWKVDFIITHDAPAHVTYKTNKYWRISEVSEHLEQIYGMTEFKHWFCGHLHRDNKYKDVSILYHSVIDVERYLNDGNNSKS
jgi:Icc-related predicted phosphoesterase